MELDHRVSTQSSRDFVLTPVYFHCDTDMLYLSAFAYTLTVNILDI